MFFGAIGEFALGEFMRPVAVVVPARRQQPTHDKYRLRRDKFNVYIEENVTMEEALALWYALVKDDD